MTACHACADFESTRQPALYNAGCLDCSARALAHGPLFFDSEKDGKPTERYKTALLRVFGEGWKDGHQLVRSYAARIKGRTE